jgi:hypothetical protein
VSAALLELGVDLLIVAALVCLGWALIRLVAPSSGPMLALSLAYPAAAALLTWVIYVASLLKVPIDAISVSAAYVLLLAILLGFGRRRPAATPPHGCPHLLWQLSPGQGAVVLALASLCLIAARVSVERSYSTWDAMAIWSIKGYGIAREGTVFAAGRWGAQGLAYPLNLPLQIGIFRIYAGDLLPGSKLIFPIYYLSLTLGVFSILQERLGWKRAGLGALVLATTPAIFQHATLGYANLPFTAYLVLGTLLLSGRCRPAESGDLGMAGILMAGAAWTRAEGLYLVPMIAAAALLANNALGRKPLRLSLNAIPFLAVEALWQPVAGTSPSTSVFLQAIPQALKGWAQFDFHFSAIYWIARYTARQAIEPEVWGVLLPVVIILWMLSGHRLAARWHPASVVIMSSALAIGLWDAAYFYLSSYPFDVQYLLGTSVNRLFMPFWVLVLLAALVLEPQDSNETPAPSV